MEIKRQGKESSQSLVYRFTRAVKKSGVLVESRKRRFRTKDKSENMKNKAAVLREEKKKEYQKLRKLGKSK